MDGVRNHDLAIAGPAPNHICDRLSVCLSVTKTLRNLEPAVSKSKYTESRISLIHENCCSGYRVTSLDKYIHKVKVDGCFLLIRKPSNYDGCRLYYC